MRPKRRTSRRPLQPDPMRVLGHDNRHISTTQNNLAYWTKQAGDAAK